MITIDGEVFLNRKETAIVLDVSVHTLEVWRSVDRHVILHENYFKWKSRESTYKLSDVGKFLKQWNPERYYEHYPRISKEFTDGVAKPVQCEPR